MSTLKRALLVDGGNGWGRHVSATLAGAGIDRICIVDTFRRAVERLTVTTTLIVTEVRIGRDSCFSLLDEAGALGHGPLIIATSTRAPLEEVFSLRDYGVHCFMEQPLSQTKLRTLFNSGHCGDEEPQVPRLLSRPPPGCELSPAEHAILRCLHQGMTYEQIAISRRVTRNTVKTQVRAVLAKLGAVDQKSLWRRMAAKSAISRVD